MKHRAIYLAIMLGLVGWGAFHAVGAFRYNSNPMRAVVVLACVGAFLGFWLFLLAWRGSHPPAGRGDDEVHPPAPY